MSHRNPPISTPLFVRWQRLQRQLIPLLAVLLGSGAAWRLWHEAPRITALGQVDVETVNVHSPAAGQQTGPTGSSNHAPRLLDSVTAGQVLARIKKSDGQFVDITSPIHGQITQIHIHPGDPVTPGQKLYTISGDQGLSITTYLRSDQPARPEPGMIVDIRQRSGAPQTIHAVIERVGAQYEPIPPAQLRDRKTEEWGLPVIITLPDNTNLKPGELVYVGWPPPGRTSGG